MWQALSDTVVDESYCCAARTRSLQEFRFDKRQAPGSQTTSTLEQNRTIASRDVAVAKTIYSSVHNSEGQQSVMENCLNCWISTTSELDGVTSDTFVDHPGGKRLHYHSESDSSVTSSSTVHYWRSIMYPDLSDSEAREAVSDWYQFYLIPVAGHCGTNSLQPGAHLQINMETIMGKEPPQAKSSQRYRVIR
ncbi:hypothetical protein CHU98_g5116 [Xylaria longipes]|nr:hypothetical protein CHU98_g5116 [Xylaria longipes]